MQKRQVLIAGFFGLMVVGLSIFAADQVQAADSNGPYYATPSWDQKLPAATRFVVLTDWNDEAVLDRETGLVWERSPGTFMGDVIVAKVACISRTTGNRKGWRLPSVHELASLMDPSVAVPGPTLPPGHPFTNVQDTYWSITTLHNSPDDAWLVNFLNADVFANSRTVHSHFWCVRGGMSADQY